MKHDSYVLDCSAIIAVIFMEKVEHLAELEAIILNKKLLVPSIWRYEVANVLLQALKQERITKAQLLEYQTLLQALPIDIDESSTLQTLGNTFRLAEEYKLSIYDAAYLELAMRSGSAMATYDKALKRAAVKVGVFTGF